jgi:hypothetical protein
MREEAEMPIDGNRKLKVGTKLVAKYKGTIYHMEVIETKDGIRYRLSEAPFSEFKSPSAAGSEVMGGNACNGWRFWSLAGSEEAEPKPKKIAKPKAAKKTTRKPKADRKSRATKAKASTTPNTPAKALSEEQAEVNKEVAQIKGGFEHLEGGRYFCPGCMDSFAPDTDEEPKACPEGHTPVGVEEELVKA